MEAGRASDTVAHGRGEPHHRLRFDRNELAGAIGDIGIFVPILAALVTFNHVNAVVALVGAGALYVVAGLYFRVPVPVQPLKVVAAIAIATGVGPGVLSAAGLWVGVVLTLLALTGLVDSVGRLFTKPVVRGVQLALGLTLVQTGYTLVTKEQFLLGGAPVTFQVLGRTVPAGLIAAFATGAIILVLKSNSRWPASLIVVGLGAAAGLAFGDPAKLGLLGPGLSTLRPGLPSRLDFFVALPLLVLPQLPLTVANSLVSTSSAASGYFGEKASRVTLRRLAFSLGIANLIGGIFGGIPLCHGAGGMTAHYRFGARTGGANVVIGALFIFIALVLGKSAVALMSLVPVGVYGALLIYLGVEHAVLIGDLAEDRQHLFAAVAVGALSAASGNMLVAVVAGVLLDGAVRLLARRHLQAIYSMYSYRKHG